MVASDHERQYRSLLLAAVVLVEVAEMPVSLRDGHAIQVAFVADSLRTCL